MKLQGKCDGCQKGYRFIWPKRLADAYCPVCGVKLARTTHLLKWEWLDKDYCFDRKQAESLWQAMEKANDPWADLERTKEV
jgi:predicted amidophosphoribosyltransferase